MARACACFILRALLLQQLQLPLVSETYPGYDLDNWGLQWDPPPDPRPASLHPIPAPPACCALSGPFSGCWPTFMTVAGTMNGHERDTHDAWAVFLKDNCTLENTFPRPGVPGQPPPVLACSNPPGREQAMSGHLHSLQWAQQQSSDPVTFPPEFDWSKLPGPETAISGVPSYFLASVDWPLLYQQENMTHAANILCSQDDPCSQHCQDLYSPSGAMDLQIEQFRAGVYTPKATLRLQYSYDTELDTFSTGIEPPLNLSGDYFGGFNFSSEWILHSPVSSHAQTYMNISFELVGCPPPCMVETLQGDPSLCGVDAQWKFLHGAVTAFDRRPDIEPRLRFNNTLDYRCDSGYRLNQSNGNRICNKTGYWTNALPTCSCGCKLPPPPANGYVELQNGSRPIAGYWCEDGYRLVGANQTCGTRNGTRNGEGIFPFSVEKFEWAGSAPTCQLACHQNISSRQHGVPVQHHTLTNNSVSENWTTYEIPNGKVYYLNATANVTCDPGYHMNMGASGTYSWRHYVCNSTANTSMYGLYVMPPSTDAGTDQPTVESPECVFACSTTNKDAKQTGHTTPPDATETIDHDEQYFKCKAGYTMLRGDSHTSLQRGKVKIGKCTVDTEQGEEGSCTASWGDDGEPILTVCWSTVTLVVVSCCVVLLLVATVCCCACSVRKWTKKRRASLNDQDDPLMSHGLDVQRQGGQMSKGFVDAMTANSDKYRHMLEADAIEFADINVFEKVGIGSSAAVFKARYHGTECAVKRLNLMLREEEEKLFKAEVKMLLRLRHPNVVQFFGVSFAHDDCYLVTEYCNRGSLFEFLQNKANKLELELQLQMAADAARGLSFLHVSGIIHRDIKSGNLLVTQDLRVKICDFGISRHVNMQNTMTTSLGTVPWTAPEMLRGERYSKKVDCYSFGVCLWELVTRRIPYDGVQSVRIITSVINGMRPQLPPDCPTFFNDLISECWAHKPAVRPTAATIVNRLECSLAALHGTPMPATPSSKKGSIQEGPGSDDRSVLYQSPKSVP